MEIKRLTAKKASIKELNSGKYVKREGFESSYVLTNLGRKLSRVRVLALIVGKFISDDEKYATITLDDSTDTIRCKAFVNTKIFDGFGPGDFVDVFGKLREYNDEIYIMSEILRKADPNLETMRMLELENIYKDQKEKIKRIQELQKQTSDINELKPLVKDHMTLDDLKGIIEAQEINETMVHEKTASASEIKSQILKMIERWAKEREQIIRKF